MRSGRPGPVLIDLPFDVQMAEIEFDIDTYEPLPVYKPAATRAPGREGARHAAWPAERPLIVAGGGIINADASRAAGRVRRADRRAGDPHADGLGHHPRRPPADGRHVRPADQPPLRQRDDAGERLRAGHRQPLGEPPHRLGRGLHARAASSCTSTSSRPRSAACSRPTSASSPMPRRRWNCSSQVARERKAAGKLARPRRLGRRCAERKRTMLRKTDFDEVPIKPQRVYEEHEQGLRRATRSTSRTIGLSQIAGAQFLHVYGPRHWINCGQAGPLGWTIPAALGRAWRPTRPARSWRLSGDYDFQFLIEELAVGAQFKLPYVHVLVNNSLPRPDPPGAARLRHGLLRAAGVREHQHAESAARCAATASTTSRSSRAWAARRSACTDPEQIEPAHCAGAERWPRSTGCRSWSR